VLITEERFMLQIDEMRLSQIRGTPVFVLARTFEESGSTRTDQQEEDLVYGEDGRWFRVTLVFTRGHGVSVWTENKKEISKPEFDELTKGREPVDLASIRAAIAERDTRIAEEENARPKCPKCKAPMRQRAGSTPFWGCSSFRKCKGTRPI
jgi:hypothetical protein